MTARSVPEWIGRRPESMPGKLVLLRLYTKQNGICACGCGRVMNLERDQIDCDHKIALKDGGENRESNLQLMFHEHHMVKTVDENVARARATRHQAKAFTSLRGSKKKRGLPRGPEQNTATRPIDKWSLLSPNPRCARSDRE